MRDLLNAAVEEVARQADRKGWIDLRVAGALASTAMAVILHSMDRKLCSAAGTLHLLLILRRCREDVFLVRNRLSAPDIASRGDILAQRILGKKRARRIAQKLSALGDIDPDTAARLLFVVSTATVSAIVRTRRRLNLTVRELCGVLKSEAAINGAVYLATARDLWLEAGRPSHPETAARRKWEGREAKVIALAHQLDRIVAATGPPRGANVATTAIGRKRTISSTAAIARTRSWKLSALGPAAVGSA